MYVWGGLMRVCGEVDVWEGLMCVGRLMCAGVDVWGG